MKKDKIPFIHAYNDLDVLETAKNRFGTNFIVGKFTECYLMQEDRIVFIGTKKNAINFIEANQGTILEGL